MGTPISLGQGYIFLYFFLKKVKIRIDVKAFIYAQMIK